MSPPKLIKDNKDPLLKGGDGDVCVEIVKSKTVKHVTLEEEEEKLQTTEEETPKKRAARKRASLIKKIIYTIVAFAVLGLFLWQSAIILGKVLGLRGPVEKEVSTEVSETEKLKKIANTFWSYTEYKNPDGKDLYKSSARGFFIGLDKDNCLDILDDLEAIDQTYLSRPTQLDYAVLKFSLNSYVEGYEWIKFGKPNCISFLNDVLSPRYWNHERETETGYALKYSIVNSAEVIDEMTISIVEMWKAVKEKRTNYHTSMVRVPDMIDAHLTRLQNTSRNLLSENILSSNYTDKYGNDRSMHYYLSRFRMGYRLRPIQALHSMKKFIIYSYIPKGRPSAGVNSYDRGDEYYAACLRHFVSKDVTVDEVRNTGLKEVARIKGLMEKIMTDEGFNGTLREYFTYLSTERLQDFYNRTEDELLSGFRTIIDNRINPKLQEIFYEEHIPNQPIKVQAMEQDLLPSSYADSVFSPNLWRPETRPTFLMMAVALHESNPGHHLQASYSKKHFDLPYRHVEWPQEHHSGPSAVPAFTSYVEGWGSYAEYLGEELGLYDSSKLELFGRHSEDMLRACRLMIDTGIHAYGMTRAGAIKYLQEHVAIPIEQIKIEVDRVITWPGQASSYKMGEMTILELRREAEETLGELFEIKDFHKTVLDVGRVPLRMLEDEVRVWIEETRPAPEETSFEFPNYDGGEYLD